MNWIKKKDIIALLFDLLTENSVQKFIRETISNNQGSR